MHTRRGFLAACLVALAGCNVLPEQDDEPVEASATAPATLDADGYSEVSAGETTVETTVEVDLSGDVQITSRQRVIATVFQRHYEREGDRFGLVTAPAVRVVDQPEVIRDPLTAVEPTREVELVTGLSASEVGEWTETGSVSMLGTDRAVETATATVAGSDRRLRRVRVRAGPDSVTAIGTAGEPPFEAVARDA